MTAPRLSRHTSRSILAHLGAAALLTLSTAAGCSERDATAPVPSPVPPATPTAATPDEAPPTAPTAAADTVQDCVLYSDSLCEAVGPTTETCAAARTITGLMPAAACKAGLADMAFTKTKLAEMKKSCTELVTKLCGDLGEGSQTCAMVKQHTPTFPAERCNAMLREYPEVLAELKGMEERNKPLSAEQQAALLDGSPPTFGVAGSKVTVVEFSDFECPYCADAAKVASRLKADYADKITFVFRQFPLSFHANAHLASQAALAAGDQGKFWEYHDLLFANQRALDRASLDKYATELGLDMAAFKKALDDGTHKAAVDADLKLGEKAGVDGTPSLFVNGQRVANPTDYAGVTKLIDEALAK